MKKKVYGVLMLTVVVLVLFSYLSPAKLLEEPQKVEAQSTNFLTVTGKDIFYKGQKILLRGTNIANISALRGTNIGGIGSGNMADIDSNEQDYKEAREKWGINHVRFGMSWSWWTNDTTPNKTNFFAKLDEQVSWAKKYGIWFTPLMFTLPGDCYEGYAEDCFSFYESPTKIAQLKDFWVKMAQHYANEPAISGLDLINEPVGSPNTSPGWSDYWLSVIAPDYINAIRAVNPHVLIFITAGGEGTFFNKYTDNKIIYEFHFYAPMEVTHNGVFGGGTSNTYPGTFCDQWNGGCLLWNSKDVVKNFMTQYYGVGFGNANNVPVYVGEWGTFSGPTNSFITYQNHVAQAIAELGINHAHYSWKAGNKWGMYNLGWPMTEKEPNKNAGLAVSWAGNVFMDSTGGTTPPPPPTGSLCGNGATESGEVCDDGNTNNGDQCSSTCTNQCTSPAVWNGAQCTTTQTPFSGTAFNILAKIEAEDFDNGGEGNAFHDTTTENDAISGGEGTPEYRSGSAVDIKLMPEGGHAIGYTVDGEWLEYTINNPTAGTYNLTVNGGSIYSGKQITFEWNGALLKTVTMPQNSDWASHQSVSVTGISIPAGLGVLRATFVGSDNDLNWFQFSSSQNAYCVADYNTTGTVDLQDFQTFAANYKKTGINCAMDIIGANCMLDIADFQAFASLYKVNGACSVGGTTPPPTTPPVTPPPTTPPVTPPPTNPPPTGQSGALKMSGTSLQTSTGARFVIQGVNLEFYRDAGCSFITSGQWSSRTAVVNKIKSLGINAVRFNYYSAWLDDSTANQTQFLDMMQLFAQNGIYVMPSDHRYTGQVLSGYQTNSFPMFQAITNGVRSRGFENMLIWNPYNEPYGSTGTWSDWATANRATLDYIRNTLNFKGVVVLDTKGWAGGSDSTTQISVKNYDGTLLGGSSNVIFSNHWYPNLSYSSAVGPTISNAGTVPVLIGELGQINPGVTGIDTNYVNQVLSGVVNTGISNGHNGIFPWMWNWCDENSMTGDDFLTLNAHGNIYVNNYYNKVD